MTSELFDSMELLDDEKAAILKQRKFLVGLGMAPADHSWCGLMTRDGIPLFAGGWVEVAPGCVEVFVIPDKRMRRCPKEFHRLVRCVLRWIEGFDWCREIRTASLPIPRIDGWMKALKFRCKGNAKSYTKTGQKYKLWSRVKVDGVWEPN